jgi:hypothetical protein
MRRTEMNPPRDLYPCHRLLLLDSSRLPQHSTARLPLRQKRESTAPPTSSRSRLRVATAAPTHYAMLDAMRGTGENDEVGCPIGSLGSLRPTLRGTLTPGPPVMLGTPKAPARA